MKIKLACAALLAFAAFGQSRCEGAATVGDLTVVCRVMPYQALARLMPAGFAAIRTDAIQISLECLDDTVVAFRVTVRFGLADPVTRLVMRPGLFTMTEFTAPDQARPVVTMLRIEKLRADLPIDFPEGKK